VLYFLHKYPICKVIAFEPHADHAKQALRNLLIDGSNKRVEFHAVAAGAKTRSLHITDQKSSSTLSENASDETVPVQIVDIFPILGDRHVDILKMDIEGGEYEILADERFAKLQVSTIVMEWHSRGNGLADKQWCEERLRGLGFKITEIFTEQGHGMFWAHRGDL
jgi:FkbM family methyltransferase